MRLTRNIAGSPPDYSTLRPRSDTRSASLCCFRSRRPRLEHHGGLSHRVRRRRRDRAGRALPAPVRATSKERGRPDTLGGMTHGRSWCETRAAVLEHTPDYLSSSGVDSDAERQVAERERLITTTQDQVVGAGRRRQSDPPNSGPRLVQVAKRGWKEAKADHVPLLSAGVAFYAFWPYFLR
jgi:hypothetical protein